MKLPTYNQLAGIVPPVCTPLTPDLEVDVASLERLIGVLVEGGVSGLFVLGSTSEAAYLPDSHRQRVLEVATGVTAGEVPVIAGAIDMTTMRVLAHAEAAAKAGCQGVVVTAPFYTRTHPAEIALHFRLLAERSELPVYAYDVPASVHSKLDPAMVLSLAAEGTLAGIKDSSGNDDDLRRLLVGRARLGQAAKGFSVLTGSELTVDMALGMGADGAVPGLANVDPVGYSRLFNLCRAGNSTAATIEQERLLDLYDIVGVGDNSRMGKNSAAIGAFKAALHLRGVIDCPVTAPPQIQLDDDDVERIGTVLARTGLR